MTKDKFLSQKMYIYARYYFKIICMKQTLTFFLLAIPLFCMAENLPRYYDYDEAGNRILRTIIPMDQTPHAPQDPSNEFQNLSNELSELLFIEKVAQVEIKIYPNPTTEKVTLKISNMERLQTGEFKLFSLTGQLLQTHPVHSETTIISLANLPKGAYILKVHINDRTEDWKIIKN